MNYETLSEQDKAQIIEAQIVELEREHFTWGLNRARYSKMTLSGEEREKALEDADNNLKRIEEAIEIARAQRDEIAGVVATVNGNA